MRDRALYTITFNPTKKAELNLLYADKRLNSSIELFKNNKPDFTPLIKASETVGKAIKQGAVAVFESTVYPGATEEICIPVLENISGLQYTADFHAGYSPERINPAAKEPTVTKIIKIVSD